MKKTVAIMMILCLLSGIALADKTVNVSTRSGDFYIELANWMSPVKGKTLHKGKILDAEPSDWGYMSDNGVLMVNAGYIGIIRAKHQIYRLIGNKKKLVSEKTFTVNVIPQKVSITKAFQIADDAVQVRFNAVPGTDYYRVALGKGAKVLKTQDTYNLSKDFKNLKKGVYWVMVCAVTDVWGTELCSKASERVKVIVK